jgi:hypothetical protein
MKNILQQLSDEMADVTAGIHRSLVQLTDGNGAIGAGTVWHEDGLIVTNAHVVVERMWQMRPMSRGYRPAQRPTHPPTFHHTRRRTEFPRTGIGNRRTQ